MTCFKCSSMAYRICGLPLFFLLTFFFFGLLLPSLGSFVISFPCLFQRVNLKHYASVIFSDENDYIFLYIDVIGYDFPLLKK